jgi:hypothetical protein
MRTLSPRLRLPPDIQNEAQGRMWSKYYRVGFYGAAFEDLDNKYAPDESLPQSHALTRTC